MAQPATDDGGKLVTEAFTATGGHDHECIIAGHQVFDDGFLVSFKVIEAKMFLECGDKVDTFRNGFDFGFRGFFAVLDFLAVAITLDFSFSQY